MTRRSAIRRVPGAIARLASDREYRRQLRLAWLPYRGMFNPARTTFARRYPEIFDFLETALADRAAPRLMSFGCSTGEEVLGLSDRFPAARITGIDIDPGNVAASLRATVGIAGITIRRAASLAGEPTAAYDAILCMAVVRNGQLDRRRPSCCDRYLRFADFAALAADFERCLAPGGLLALRHSNFRLRDTPVAGAFETVFARPYSHGPRPVIYGPDDRLMPGIVETDAVFRKLGAGV